MNFTPEAITIAVLGLICIIWWIRHEILTAPSLDNDEEYCEEKGK